MDKSKETGYCLLCKILCQCCEKSKMDLNNDMSLL
jgi:hypothetical protein